MKTELATLVSADVVSFHSSAVRVEFPRASMLSFHSSAVRVEFPTASTRKNLPKPLLDSHKITS